LDEILMMLMIGRHRFNQLFVYTTEIDRRHGFWLFVPSCKHHFGKSVGRSTAAAAASRRIGYFH
jgi:hypothetical protein